MPEITGPPTGTVVGVTLYNVNANDTRGTLRTARAVVAESGTTAAPRWEVPWDGTTVDYDWDYTTGGVTTTIPERKYATDPRIATIAGDAASAAISATAIAAKLPVTGPVASKGDVDSVPSRVWDENVSAHLADGTVGKRHNLIEKITNLLFNSVGNLTPTIFTEMVSTLLGTTNSSLDPTKVGGQLRATTDPDWGNSALRGYIQELPTLAEMVASPAFSKAPTGWVLVTHATAGQSICTDNFGNALGGMTIVAFMHADTARTTPVNDAISSSVPGKVGQWGIMLPTGAIDLVFLGAGQRTTTVEVTV